jgi:CrcB protein
MQLLLLACAGGAIGAGLRFLVNQAFAVRGLIAFPWPTLAVNVAGGFLMGVVYVFVHERLGGSPEWRTFLATGILGGLTTFSAYSLDMMNLMTIEGLGGRFFAYAIGSVVLAFAALAAGMALTRMALA